MGTEWEAWEAPAFVTGQFTTICGNGDTMVTTQPVERKYREWKVVYSNTLEGFSAGIGMVGGPYKPQREESVTGNKSKIQRSLKGCVACLPSPEKGCCFRG